MRSVIYGLMLLVVGCGSVDTMVVDRASFHSLPIVTSPAYGFRVSVQGDVPMPIEELAHLLDVDFTQFTNCMADNYGVEITPGLAQEFHYVIVPKQFECSYHSWCGGEWREGDYMILAYDTPEGGPLVYSLHEWRQAYDPQHRELSDICARGL